MVSALAHADEQLVDEFSKAASILDLKIKPLDHKKLEGGVFYLLSVFTDVFSVHKWPQALRSCLKETVLNK